MAHFIAIVDATFEYPDTIVAAQDWVLSKFEGVKINRASVTRWSDPITNEPRTYAYDGVTKYRYSVYLSLTFEADGYGAAQNFAYQRLMQDKELTHMNIQQIQLSGSV